MRGEFASGRGTIEMGRKADHGRNRAVRSLSLSTLSACQRYARVLPSLRAGPADVLSWRPDDPCRRPLMDAAGQVRTRAPLWWLRLRVGPLLEFLERS
jgi:hypothetical protein